MPFIEAALAFDGNGLPVHKTDKVMVDWGAVVEKTTEPESIIEVEVYDIPTSNQIVLVSPQDGSLHVVPSGSVKVN